ncbi:uracil-DNA glycosylase [Candidatus Planktophila sulfonica]|nr:uracil-DNA glycosylase [Candidatus Planktophila sulfonica]
MKDLASSHVHSSWETVFEPINPLIAELLSKIASEDLSPSLDSIFRAFQFDLDSIRCVIVGQDPYPTPGNAMGLAFSTPPSVERIPQSLRNIFKELEDDQGITPPTSGDLSAWSAAGVLLLNRVLTTRQGESNAHTNIGWQRITDHIASELGKRDVVAVLWGKQAQELSIFFTYKIEGVHPSPLSAYRGFFGSKPFTQVNQLLVAQGREPIDWKL